MADRRFIFKISNRNDIALSDVPREEWNRTKPGSVAYISILGYTSASSHKGIKRILQGDKRFYLLPPEGWTALMNPSKTVVIVGCVVTVMAILVSAFVSDPRRTLDFMIAATESTAKLLDTFKKLLEVGIEAHGRFQDIWSAVMTAIEQ